MAESVQPRAGVANHDPAKGPMHGGGYSAPASASGQVSSAQKPKLGGSIVAGILVGAVAAFLVGGLMGMHETTTGVLSLEHSAISTR
jgi:hypothetical protein